MSKSSTALAAPSKGIERPAPSATPATGKPSALPLQDSAPLDSTDAGIQRTVKGMDRMVINPVYRRKVATGRR